VAGSTRSHPSLTRTTRSPSSPVGKAGEIARIADEMSGRLGEGESHISIGVRDVSC
jgi:hypothetical protein